MSSSPASSARAGGEGAVEVLSMSTNSGSDDDYDGKTVSSGAGDNDSSMTTTTTNTANMSREDEIKTQSMNIEKTTKRTVLMAALVTIMGAVAAVSFLFVAITNEQEEKESLFLRRATDLAESIDISWRDYETAALWVHNACHNWRASGYNRDDFKDLFQYLDSSGLDFFVIEWVPNITQAERPLIENATREYYRDDPRNFYSGGFTGMEPVPGGEEGEIAQLNRSEQPFYFPIHFVEPWQNGGFATHLDLWSIGYEQPVIRTALEQVVPVMTARFVLVPHTLEKDGYSVVLYHPGKPVSIENNDTHPVDLSNIIVQINSLLARAASAQGVSLGAYLYDSTITEMDPELPPEFMGGIKIDVTTSTIKNGMDSQELDNRTLSKFPEIPLAELEQQSDPNLYYQHNIFVGQRSWKVVVVPVDDSYEPAIMLAVLSGVMIFVAAFLLSIWMLHNMRKSIKMNRILSEAAAEAAIVSNLFPANVRERMIQDAKNRNNLVGASRKEDVFLKDGVGGGQHGLAENKLGGYLSSEGIFGSKPIAELHPYTTIMFADLVGFTAWSSVREPYQVFTLLEILYHSYDNIAARRRVFKVETVGDCYVAVCGLPERRKDHAVVMARFATDCLYRMHKLVKALEVSLGPDTGDLSLRVGLHSGQVTAGVLRGDKGRFQLFGDTMNTASRMESTGVRNKIQVSQETADHLKDSGKEDWLVPRKEMITAKGKGTLQTYFLKTLSGSQQSAEFDERVTRGSNFVVPRDQGNLRIMENTKMQRLVDWNAEVLGQLLKRIVARRAAAMVERKDYVADFHQHGDARMPLDEVVPIIKLPDLDRKAIKKQVDPERIELDAEVVGQLRDLVTSIAGEYHTNPFHNFEHASHVCMSVQKMLSRIINPTEIHLKKHKGDYEDESKLESELHDHTFGITSDPLTHFACAFSALIHDLDHQGVPNSVLMNEGSPLVKKYHEKSLAEQNSIDLTWEILADPKYDKLLKTICCDELDFRRFRELVVNSVCATDIMDKQLGGARKARWEVAFNEEPKEEPKATTVNRKATIVLEHLIQASDVSHTMQHWHIYAKWNQRLFMELYKAYKAGRLEKDPSIGWYEGEMGFFDFYIIPLAKKLFKCGVFGVSSDEFLNYAQINRKEWEKKGAQLVQKYLRDYEEDFGTAPDGRLCYDSCVSEDEFDDESVGGDDAASCDC
ncbi:Receptor-type guanylate cyclase gcy [Seminavis robusta]|uniref:Phosphodiesterase n=1 Tax=Seminavis robusta TaxID=568900 RepID=A0A9N8DGV2_9STRA|nr:Receptor-type guanylate cyclase gcy [Seminavis robusta]|eukprot:Sro136_g064000.1 Receptor-type guanylate cyclase gcy (1188) ;mRNA; f:23667-28607